ncbi:MAG TPA: hypothetical protein VEI02_02815 [Planctomycetota bacterium]|nr:hypothetical protein [Planctomycetota bacterium]
MSAATPRTVRRRERGFTMLEVILAGSMIAFVFGLYASSVADAIGVATTGVSTVSLQEEARRILERLRRDVAMTGGIDAAADPLGVAFPVVSINGQAPTALATHFQHDVATLTAIASTFAPAPEPPEPFNPPPYVAPGNELEPYGFREFLFRLPRDVTGDGRICSTGGAVEWGPEVFGYLVLPRPGDKNGLCDLVRRSVDEAGAVVDEVICSQIEAATFDTVATKEILPADAVEIHLHLLREDAQGKVRRLHVATTLVMRN